MGQRSSSSYDVPVDFRKLTNDHEKELLRLREQDPQYKDNFAPLYSREWITVNDAENDGKNDETTVSFSLLQFNILADGLSGVYGGGSEWKSFDKAPKESLRFEYRGFRILEQILAAEPDVVTLEEVDTFDFLTHYLAPKGYKGLHKTKSFSPTLKIGKKAGKNLAPDGVAIFYKDDKFLMVQECDTGGSPVSMLLRLRFKAADASNKEILVGCTHLKAAKTHEGEQIRLQQLQTLLPKWKAIHNKLDGTELFIGCDFNSPPKNTQGFPPMAYLSVVRPQQFVGDYVTEQQQPSNEEKGNDGSGDEPPSTISVPKEYEPGYGLNLSSAYLDGLGDEPPFTTYKSRGTVVAHTIDYIFYEKEKWTVSQLLSLPKDEEIDKSTFIPAWNYPSDHFAIAAAFKLK